MAEIFILKYFKKRNMAGPEINIKRYAIGYIRQDLPGARRPSRRIFFML
jgi:hypothetical protein